MNESYGLNRTISPVHLAHNASIGGDYNMLPNVRVKPLLDAKNQYIIYHGEGVAFQSYNVIVAYINNTRELTFTKYWNYSQTTRKYLYEWLNVQRFVCDRTTSGEIYNALSSKNKAQALQRLIDTGVIKYDETEQ